MTKNDSKREIIFEKYSNHLKLLKDNGLIDIDLVFAATYVCPICLRQFSKEALNQNEPNPLTIEDVPPKSLSGKGQVLTCCSCNNLSGQEYDYHLVNTMRHMDKTGLVPGSKFDAMVAKGGTVTQSEITVGTDGLMSVHVPYKKNNPEVVNQDRKPWEKDDVVEIIFYTSKIDFDRVNIAFLKIGYLTLFATYGYAFILDPAYEQIRHQLLHPETDSYSDIHILTNDYIEQKNIFGAAFVGNQGMESVLSIFSLKTDKKERCYQVFLPLPNRPLDKIRERLGHILRQTNNILTVSKPPLDYLTNIDSIASNIKLIESLK